MKKSTQAVLLYLLFYSISYFSKYFGWGSFSQYKMHQINLEIFLVTIIILLYYILREIEESEEEGNG